jgi:hypothetical protein
MSPAFRKRVSGPWRAVLGSPLTAGLALLTTLTWWVETSLPREGAGAEVASATRAAAEPDDGAFQRQLRPLLRQYCVECHEGPGAKAEIDLARYRNATEALRDQDVWELVYDMVEARRMPPAQKPQPTDQEVRLILEWIERHVFKVECGKIDPGRVTLRRLNRTEYTFTIQDLLQISIGFADQLPSDEVGYGFDNIADVLTVSPLLLEKYLSCAEQALAQAIVVPPRPRELSRRAEQLEGGALVPDRGRVLASNGSITAELDIPETGLYQIVLDLGADQAGGELPRAEVLVDGQSWKTLEVRASGQDLESHRLTAKLSAGRHRLEVRFLNDYYRPDAADPKDRDRNLVVSRVTLRGPLRRAAEPLPPSHRAIFVCTHADNDELHHLDCARLILRRFATRAYRRPVTHDELERLLGLTQEALQQGLSFEESIQVALEAVLLSPYFLYRVELDPEPNAAEGIRPLNDYELATRLSYFLWTSMPDDELLELAQKGRLTDTDVLRRQAQRLLSDPKSSRFVRNFGEQWLQLRNLANFNPDPRRFPEFNEELRRAMYQETLLFLETVAREDRPILDFLHADYTWVNEPLARLYGIPGVSGKEFRRVKLADPVRGGVLTQASVLAVTSNPTRTSPVKRGKWILETILGSPPPPPPPNTPELPETKVTGQTLKERLQKHRENPSCAVCHEEMDSLGFALENFDPIGKWRIEDEELPVDASGTLPGGVTIQGPEDLKRVLLSRADQFATTFTEKLLTYALGRGLSAADRCAVEEILHEAKQQGYRFSSFVIGVVLSEPFRYRRTADSPSSP